MRTFTAACLASLTLADVLIQSGIDASYGDEALSAIFARESGHPGDEIDGDVNVFADEFAVHLNEWFLENAKAMPDVCEAGMQCRRDVQDKTVIDMTDSIENTMREIDDIYYKSFTRSQSILETAYAAAQKCDDGCTIYAGTYCYEAQTVYADIVRQQRTITQDVLILTTKEQELITSQDGYLVSCPEYQYVQLTGDQTVQIYDVSSFTHDPEIINHDVQVTMEQLDSTQDQTIAPHFDKTDDVEEGVISSTASSAVIDSGEGEWQESSTSTTTTEVYDQEMGIQSGYISGFQPVV